MRPDDRFAPQRGAAGWQVSNPPILALAALGASLEMFDKSVWIRFGTDRYA